MASLRPFAPLPEALESTMPRPVKPVFASPDWGDLRPVLSARLVQLDHAAYTEWMAAVGKNPLKGCSYDLHTSCYDESSKTAIFFATFTGTHVGEGGPVPPTDKQTKTHYVYVLTMNNNGQVEKMCKVWNAPWALKELGWM